MKLNKIDLEILEILNEAKENRSGLYEGKADLFLVLGEKKVYARGQFDYSVRKLKDEGLIKTLKARGVYKITEKGVKILKSDFPHEDVEKYFEKDKSEEFKNKVVSAKHELLVEAKEYNHVCFDPEAAAETWRVFPKTPEYLEAAKELEKEGIIKVSEVQGDDVFVMTRTDAQKSIAEEKIKEILMDNKTIYNRDLWDKVSERDDIVVMRHDFTSIVSKLERDGFLRGKLNTSGYHQGETFLFVEGKEGVEHKGKILSAIEKADDLHELYSIEATIGYSPHKYEYQERIKERRKELDEKQTIKIKQELEETARKELEIVFDSPEEREVLYRFIEKEKVDLTTILGYFDDSGHIPTKDCFMGLGNVNAHSGMPIANMDVPTIAEGEIKKKKLYDNELVFGLYDSRKVWKAYGILGKGDVEIKVDRVGVNPLIMQKGDLIVYVAPHLSEEFTEAKNQKEIWMNMIDEEEAKGFDFVEKKKVKKPKKNKKPYNVRVSMRKYEEWRKDPRYTKMGGLLGFGQDKYRTTTIGVKVDMNHLDFDEVEKELQRNGFEDTGRMSNGKTYWKKEKLHEFLDNPTSEDIKDAKEKLKKETEENIIYREGG